MKGTMLGRMKGLALLGAMAGCVSLDGLIAADAGSEDAGGDAGAIEVDGADAGAETDSEVAPPPEEDAGQEVDADVPERPNSRIDAGIGIIEDAGWQRDTGAQTDATVEPQPIACAGNGECKADEICGPEHTCMPRCTSFGACVVAQGTREVTRMETDGDALYWSLAVTQDVLGNRRRDGELWRMVPGQAPVRLSNQLDDQFVLQPFHVHAEYAYLARGREIHRARVDLSEASTRVQTFAGTELADWAVGDGFIAMSDDGQLSVGSLDDSQPMHALTGAVAQGARVVQLMIVDDRVYFRESSAHDGESFIGVKSLRPAEPNAVSTEVVASESSLYPSVVNLLGVHDRLLCYTCTPYNRVCSSNLDDGSKKNVAGDLSAAGQSTIIGDWVYWYQWPQPNGFLDSILTRYSLNSIGTVQTIIAADAGAILAGGSGRPTVVGNRFYTATYFGNAPWSAIYAMPLPPEPCATDLPCPTGKSCGGDALCH